VTPRLTRVGNLCRDWCFRCIRAESRSSPSSKSLARLTYYKNHWNINADRCVVQPFTPTHTCVEDLKRPLHSNTSNLQFPLQRQPKIKVPVFQPRTHTPRLQPLWPILPLVSIPLRFDHLDPTPPPPTLRHKSHATPPLRTYQHRLFILRTNVIRINRRLQFRLERSRRASSCWLRTRRLRQHQAKRDIRRIDRQSRNPAPGRQRAREEWTGAIAIAGSRREDADGEGFRR
jgi:hypothetical protein